MNEIGRSLNVPAVPDHFILMVRVRVRVISNLCSNKRLTFIKLL